MMLHGLCQGRRPRWLQGDISSLALVQWGQTRRDLGRFIRCIRSPQTGSHSLLLRIPWTQSHRPVGRQFSGTYRRCFAVFFPGFFFQVPSTAHQASGRFSHAACVLQAESPRDLRERHDREMHDHICHSPSEAVFLKSYWLIH